MREFSISAKLLMISQILLLVSVCLAVVFIFMDAEQRTVDSLLTMIIDRKGKVVNDYVLMEIQQPVDTVVRYGVHSLKLIDLCASRSLSLWETCVFVPIRCMYRK